MFLPGWWNTAGFPMVPCISEPAFENVQRAHSPLLAVPLQGDERANLKNGQSCPCVSRTSHPLGVPPVSLHLKDSLFRRSWTAGFFNSFLLVLSDSCFDTQPRCKGRYNSPNCSCRSGEDHYPKPKQTVCRHTILLVNRLQESVHILAALFLEYQ